MKYFRTIFLLAAMGMLLVPPPGDADIFPINDDITDLRPENQGTHVRRTDTHLWVGLSGFQFLKIGQGARAVAMGDAYTAVADDINAIFWNPAGLTGVRGTAWTANYTKWLVGLGGLLSGGGLEHGYCPGRGARDERDVFSARGYPRDDDLPAPRHRPDRGRRGPGHRCGLCAEADG